jgi:hypothetical protein
MKKAFATIALTLTVLFGATFVNAGIIVTDNSGVCVIDPITMLMGIIVTDYSGGVQCVDRTGIIVTD